MNEKIKNMLEVNPNERIHLFQRFVGLKDEAF